MKKFPVRAITATGALGLSVLGWTSYRNFDALTGAISGNGAVGLRIPDVEVDGSKHHVHAYRSQGQRRIVFLLRKTLMRSSGFLL